MLSLQLLWIHEDITFCRKYLAVFQFLQSMISTSDILSWLTQHGNTSQIVVKKACLAAWVHIDQRVYILHAFLRRKCQTALQFLVFERHDARWKCGTWSKFIIAFVGIPFLMCGSRNEGMKAYCCLMGSFNLIFVWLFVKWHVCLHQCYHVTWNATKDVYT